MKSPEHFPVDGLFKKCYKLIEALLSTLAYGLVLLYLESDEGCGFAGRVLKLSHNLIVLRAPAQKTEMEF
jgi:hypothetical protein